ncbi:MAG: hypothetical protein QW230_00810 [Thermofilum sp.]
MSKDNIEIIPDAEPYANVKLALYSAGVLAGFAPVLPSLLLLLSTIALIIFNYGLGEARKEAFISFIFGYFVGIICKVVTYILYTYNIFWW